MSVGLPLLIHNALFIIIRLKFIMVYCMDIDNIYEYESIKRSCSERT